VLKITINETLTEKRWILEGRLVGQGVGELRRSWKKTQRDQVDEHPFWTSKM
jgi:hypothetical protein